MKTWLVSKLSSKDEVERTKAEQTLESLGPAGVDLVMELVRDEAVTRRKKRKRNRIVGTILALAIFAIVAAWIINGVTTGKWGHTGFPFYLFAKLFAPLFGAYAVSNAQSAGTKWLTQFQDPRLVSSLLDAMDTDDKELQHIAEGKLVELLPAMESYHGDVLTPEQRIVLRGQLKSINDDLVIKVLRALVVLADIAAMPDVQAMLVRQEKRFKPNRELIAEGRRTLTELEALKEQARLKETLLRPAEAAPGQYLLRPEITHQETDPATLLRPMNSM